MTLGPVRVMEAGVVVMLCVEKVVVLKVIGTTIHFFLIVSCPTITNPSNGIINCSLGNDGLPSYEDTCSFTCNTGYELTGSDTTTCQSNGSWSDSDVICIRGIFYST